MFPIITPQLLSLPEGASPSAANQRLPWSNGSLIAAKMSPSDTAGMAQLIIGGYRLTAKVPPTTPMGDIWLQLINRDMPAQFRLLNQSQVETVLAKMLQKPAASTTAETQAAKQSTEQGWGKMDTGSLPFSAEVAAHGNFLMIRDRESGHRDVLLSSTVDADQFRLLGRVDLEQLGSVAFNLQGGEGREWLLKVFSINPQLLSYLRAHFNIWLRDEQEKYQNLNGEVIYGMPENMAALARGVQA